MTDIERKVAECLNPPQGRKKGLFKKSKDIHLAKKHLEKARWDLDAMQSNFDNKFYDWSIVCGYYAMYHATMAALRLIGLEAKRHDCASAALNLFFVQKGELEDENLEAFEKAKRLEQKYVKALDKAAIKRTVVQYGVVIIDATEAEWILESARGFVAQIEDIVSEAEGIEVVRI